MEICENGISEPLVLGVVNNLGSLQEFPASY